MGNYRLRLPAGRHPSEGHNNGGIAGTPRVPPTVGVAPAGGSRTITAFRTLPTVTFDTASPPLAALQEVFGYSAFRGAQAEIVEHVVRGGDALVLIPTGGGKSLCYQVPALVRHRAEQGGAVVVSPLIALMHDQVGALEEAGVHAAVLNSTLSFE